MGVKELDLLQRKKRIFVAGIGGKRVVQDYRPCTSTGGEKKFFSSDITSGCSMILNSKSC